MHLSSNLHIKITTSEVVNLLLEDLVCDHRVRLVQRVLRYLLYRLPGLVKGALGLLLLRFDVKEYFELVDLGNIRKSRQKRIQIVVQAGMKLLLFGFSKNMVRPFW